MRVVGRIAQIMFDYLGSYASEGGCLPGSIVYEIRKNQSKDAGTEAIIAGTIASLATGAITFFLARKK
jgi:hypothetical protein